MRRICLVLAGAIILLGSASAIASKSPAAMAAGAFIVSSFRLDGNTLVIAQQRNQNGPYPSPVTFKLVRVE